MRWRSTLPRPHLRAAARARGEFRAAGHRQRRGLGRGDGQRSPEATAEGDLTPGEAFDLARVVDGFLRVIEARNEEVRVKRYVARYYPASPELSPAARLDAANQSQGMTGKEVLRRTAKQRRRRAPSPRVRGEGGGEGPARPYAAARIAARLTSLPTNGSNSAKLCSNRRAGCARSRHRRACRARCRAGRGRSGGRSAQLSGTRKPKLGSWRIGAPARLPSSAARSKRAGMGDRHALADAVGAARPAGVDEPAIGLVARDPLAEHLGVFGRVARHERRAEAGREHRLRLLAEPDLGAGDLRGIAREEMVHRLLGGELGDRRHDPERVAGQHDDVFRVRRHARARRHWG